MLRENWSSTIISARRPFFAKTKVLLESPDDECLLTDFFVKIITFCKPKWTVENQKFKMSWSFMILTTLYSSIKSQFFRVLNNKIVITNWNDVIISTSISCHDFVIFYKRANAWVNPLHHLNHCLGGFVAITRHVTWNRTLRMQSNGFLSQELHPKALL